MKNFGLITRKYLGLSFNECNCLRLLYNIYKDIGIDIPTNYKGYTLDTYIAYWEEKPEEAIKDMIELFKTVGREIDVRFLKKGDLVVVKYKNIKWPVIYIGDNNIMSVSKKMGARVLSLGKSIQPIMARRFVS